MKTFRTSQIADKCGVHPNTVRLYEELGFIPPVPRAANGYRIYDEWHLQQVLLVRTVLRNTWLGGRIRQKALSILHLSAAGHYEEAIQAAEKHRSLLIEERKKAEIAVDYLERWAEAGDEPAEPDGKRWTTDEIVESLDITRDMLRSWERNDLISIPRDPANGYRTYGNDEIRRLYLIRALRKARFSLMAIHHMFQQYDRGIRNGLSAILNELPPEEEDIFYHTDQWLTRIRSIEDSADELLDRLNIIKDLYKP